ncbi:E3 ubiquitin-protein ligase [Porphyridium purpureum]|uniref:RING-type E3 ubiquitin transferase n=1 Tax=Porphyridium purpureum TaxID=35688 RepID=A0A5J4YTV8_PORPP|nr:E3 ubiquitin-protein ligase [Porphyridium purpureum]|eukprot:POR3217..scf227_4
MASRKKSRAAHWQQVAAAQGGAGDEGVRAGGGGARGASRDDASHCLICTNESDEWAIGRCNHPVCAECVFRMHVLYNDTACVLCKAALSDVIVIGNTPNIEHLDHSQLMTDSHLQQMVHDEPTKIRFQNMTIARKYQRLRELNCPICFHGSTSGGPDSTSTAVARSPHALHEHVRQVHSRAFCEVCFDSRKAFPCEQLVFVDDRRNKGQGNGSTTAPSPALSLKRHIKATHPTCHFCRKNFHDDDALYMHLQQAHFSCFICERQGIMYKYYARYEALAAHYRKEHFMCESEECVGVVFENKLELEIHNQTTHRAEVSRGGGGRRTGVRLNLADINRALVPGPGTHDPRASEEIRAQRQRRFQARDVIYADGTGGGRAQNGAQRRRETERNHQTQRPSHSGLQQQHAQQGQQALSALAARTSARTLEPMAGFHRRPLPESTQEHAERRRAWESILRVQGDPISVERFHDAVRRFESSEISSEVFFQAVRVCFEPNWLSPILAEFAALCSHDDMRTRLELVCYRELGRAAIDEVSSSPAGLGDTLPAVHNDDALEFPALGSNQPPVPDGAREQLPVRESVVVETAERREWAGRARNVRELDEDQFPSLVGDPDPNERVGPVWGKGKKEKQRGRGKAPAPAPDLARLSISSPDAFPSLNGNAGSSASGASGSSSPALRGTEAQGVQTALPSSSGSRAGATAVVVDSNRFPALGEGASGGSGSSASRPAGLELPPPRSRVALDLGAEQARRRQNAVPRIGSSGLPWEKKKVEQMRKQAKAELQYNRRATGKLWALHALPCTEKRFARGYIEGV